MNQSTRERAEALWEELGGDLCICQRPDVAHWCEECQRRIDIIQAAFRRLEPPRMFPIMGGPEIPWEVIGPCQSQAQYNHSQSIERLAERGGLSPAEACAVLLGLSWSELRRQYGEPTLANRAKFTDLMLELVAKRRSQR